MKLLPLTETYRQQLVDKGFTRIMLRRIIEPTDRETDTNREMHLYEAYRDGHPMLDKFISEELSFESVQKILQRETTDIYVVIHEQD